MATAFRVSCLGLSSLLAAHHASTTSLPLSLQNFSETIRGDPLSLPQVNAEETLFILARSTIFLMS